MTAHAEPRPPGRHQIIRLGVVDSTQLVAFELAEGGARDGTVVVATSQHAGRGRHGRAWQDEPGASLLLSMVVRPRLPPARWPLLSLVTGVAVAHALGRVAGVAARLKWPNDVLIDGRKVAGILLESRLGRQAVMVIGIGINVGQERFPVDLQGRATSVRQASGRLVDPDRLLDAVLDEVDGWRARLEGEGFAAVREAWKALSTTLGASVTVDSVSGQAVDLDADGALVIDDGVRRHRAMAGELMQESKRVARR